MLTISYSNKFKKDFRLVKKQNLDFDEVEFKQVVSRLAKRQPLDSKYKDHALKGKYLGARELHLKPDLLLIYKITEDCVELIILRIGSHSNLF